jgi:serine/threonine protein kinase
VIDGKYHLDYLLSSGSYGGVFAADEVVADKMMRRLAVKLITPSTEYPERQTEELMLATSMDHPNILRCFSPGVCTLNGIRLLYIVMEMASSSLADRFIEGVLSQQEVRVLAEAMFSALTYLAGRDSPLVHRDIKPANILNVNGVWKLADFGLLRGIGAERVAQTRTLLGTAEYAPPEAYEGTVSTAWDIWSLGVVLVEASTGTLPFDEGTPQELQNAIMQSAARNVDGIGEPIEPIVRGCLIKERMKRWTAEEALAVLKGTAPAPQFTAGLGRDTYHMSSRVAKYPFRFKFGMAETIPQMIEMCERFPFEAQDYLTGRDLSKWFADAMDDPGLAREASGCSRLHWNLPERGVEIFVRELRRSAGMPYDPEMNLLEKRVDFGLLSVGEQASTELHYRCAALRHAWGSIEIAGDLPGLSADEVFGTAGAPIPLWLNLMHVEPGYYEGAVLLHAEGVANPISVPVTYTIKPLKVTISPHELSFGSVEHGTISKQEILIQTGSPNVHVTVRASIVPPCPGIEVATDFSGPAVKLDVTADCGQLEAGRAYVRRVMVDTNAGTFQLPLRLRVLIPIKPIATHVCGGAIIGAAIAALVRTAIDSAGPVANHWFLQYPSTNDYEIMFRIIGSPFIALAAGFGYRRFAQWRWPLLFEQRESQPGLISSILALFRRDPD